MIYCKQNIKKKCCCCCCSSSSSIHTDEPLAKCVIDCFAASAVFVFLLCLLINKTKLKAFKYLLSTELSNKCSKTKTTHTHTHRTAAAAAAAVAAGAAAAAPMAVRSPCCFWFPYFVLLYLNKIYYLKAI